MAHDRGQCTPQACFVMGISTQHARSFNSMYRCVFAMSCMSGFHVTKNCNILCWNVRGLNASNRRDSVRNAVMSAGATIVCLQEMKIERWTSRLVRDTLGPKFVNSFAALPANGVRGGILLAVNELFFTMQNIHTTTHTISADLVMRADNTICTNRGLWPPGEQ
jgi:hypothetical protein